ncbi:hypothetical protein BCV72DRAFT_309608 [Rhizopus microsporus var. microsporus]|uniref:Uncharacterized protein n=1 Tax=Rhizopus microsporus var. microsporus TaxID=86635 RepID=A0A1X0QQ83_RHIZD|nr:hypothetical protein BCV72DRAFT_309608 [Rhizopus microsporus var. microsporus]
MKHQLILKINYCIKKESQSDLKSRLLAVTRLPRSIITEAKKLANCTPNEFKGYLESHPACKRNVKSWIDFVEEKSDAISAELLENPSAFNTYIQGTQLVKNSTEEEEFRTCPSSIFKILRQGLSNEARFSIQKELHDFMMNLSDYYRFFSSLVYMMMTELRNHVFAIENDTGKIILQRSPGFNIRGCKDETLAQRPVQLTLFDALSSFTILRESFSSTLRISSNECNIALTQYSTNLANMCPDCTSFNDQLEPQEIQVCYLVIQAFKPYISSKEFYSSLARQLSFVIFANDILQYTGYSEYCRKICPLASMASFSTMRVDAPSLFSLLNHAKSNNLLPLRDSDNFVIGSQDQARHHKDSVFTSIFDLEAVFSICKQPGLAFAQNITSLPGAKSVEMLGTRLKPNKFHCHNDLSVKQVIRAEIEKLEYEVPHFKSQLQQEYKQQKPFNFSMEWKSPRSQWSQSFDQDMRNQLYSRIKIVKQERNAAFIKQTDLKNQIRNYQQHKTVSDKRLVEKSDISPSVNIHQDFSFFGTYNGIHTMTDTVAFSMKRFKSHLKLYNRYQVLGNIQKNNPYLADILERYHEQPEENYMSDGTSFLDISKSFKVRSKSVDFGCGDYRKRKKLEKLQTVLII